MKGSLAVERYQTAEDASAELERGIHPSEEGQIERYLSAIGAKFEHSVFGAILERAINDCSASRPCPKCCGEGRYPGIALTLKKRINPVTGLSEAYEHGDYCPTCKGTAVVYARVGRRRKSPRTGLKRCHRCKGAVTTHATEPCPDCKGAGYTVGHPVFAAVAGGTGGAGYLPSHEYLVQFGMVSRRLMAVARLRMVSYRVLMAFYGDEGARWGREKHRSRMFAVYAFTPAGKKLIRHADKSEADVPLQPLELLGVIAEVARIQPDKNESKRALLDRAQAEAMALYAQACQDWNATAPTEGKTRLTDAKTTHSNETDQTD